MAEIELDNLVKIFPYQQVKGIFHRKKQRQLRLEQQSMPYEEMGEWVPSCQPRTV